MNKVAPNIMLKDTYAVLEISKNRMTFSVCKYIDKKANPVVVFSNTVNEKFLNDKDVVDNPLHAKNVLAELLWKYESSFHEEIKAIILILPTNTLAIDESTETIYADEEKTFSSNQILKNQLFDKIKNSRYKPSKSVVKIKPKHWIFDNVKYIDFPYGRLCTKIQLVCLNYSIDNEVLQSHTKVIYDNNRQILMKDFQNHVKAIKIVPPAEFISENVVLIEINKDDYSYGLYRNEGCFRFVNTGKANAIDGMTTSIANKLKIKQHIVYNYLFNLLDFNELDESSDIIYFRKMDKVSKIEISYSKQKILEEFKNYISRFVNSIEGVLKNSTNKNLENLRVYICGDITKISGIEVIFKKCFKVKTNIRIYIPLGVGEEDEATTVALGAAEEMLLSNNTIQNQRYLTSTNDFIKEHKISESEYDKLKENVPDGYTILPNINIDNSKKNKYNNFVNMEQQKNEQEKYNNYSKLAPNYDYSKNTIYNQNQKPNDIINKSSSNSVWDTLERDVNSYTQKTFNNQNQNNIYHNPSYNQSLNSYQQSNINNRVSEINLNPNLQNYAPVNKNIIQEPHFYNNDKFEHEVPNNQQILQQNNQLLEQQLFQQNNQQFNSQGNINQQHINQQNPNYINISNNQIQEPNLENNPFVHPINNLGVDQNIGNFNHQQQPLGSYNHNPGLGNFAFKKTNTNY
ncbi:hypothetical protein [Spiroplasma endosymbiont of Aspidapion aeneum]|uniref:hypothetical protein n=1 Tax=Spiroplasma endosymbiont of Aspidapion aeneum TaxID=3066276 RepID=UPI00313B8261